MQFCANEYQEGEPTDALCVTELNPEDDDQQR